MNRIIILLLISVQVFSQVFTGFGRNKIQYNDFEWFVLKTEHFDVYYYAEMEELAQKGAYYAEESFKALAKDFNHTIKRRIPLIFYSTHIHFQETNITPGFIPEGVGGFFEFLKGRVVIPGNGNINQFKKVIRHEMVHVFMHAKVNWINKQHGRYGGLQPPLWYTEGLAEYYSLNWDAQGEMIMKDAVLNNYLPRLEEMYRIHGTYTMYKVGENILRYIAKEYGKEKIQQFMENIWKGKKFEQVFMYTMGMDYKSFSDKWHYAMKKEYYPLLEEYDFADAVTDPIEHKGFNFKPHYYKKGNEVFFWSNRTGYTGIYKKSLDAIKKKTDEEDIELILTGEKSGDFESFHIFSNSFDTNENEELLFTSKTQGADALYIYNLKANEITKKIQYPQLVSILSPSWSPDNKTVVFTGLQKSGYKDLFLLDIETEKLTQLTNDFYEDNDPSWSPDGQYIVFSSDRTDKGEKWAYNLFRMNAETRQIDYLTYGKQQDLVPKYSPDGQYILYVSTENLEKNIYLVSADPTHSKKIKLTQYTSSVFDVDWVNNDEIIFSVFSGMRFKIQHLKDIQEKLSPTESPIVALAEFPEMPERTWEPELIQTGHKVAVKEYEAEYTIDIAQSQVGQDPIYGTTGGAAIGISDVLGDSRYEILIYNNAQTSDRLLKSFNFKVSKYSLGQRLNYGYGVFRFAGNRYDFRSSYYFEDEIGGDFVLEYPLDQFNRLNFYTNVRYSERDEYIEDMYYSWLNTSQISYVKDNSIWSPSGPMDGQRFKLSFGFTKDFVHDNISYFTMLADYRHYFRLTQRTTYAVRAMYLGNSGKGSRFYGLGGSWDLRGQGFLALRGDKLVLLSQEYRFPLLDFFGFKFSYGPVLGSNFIRGAVFADAGNAYSNGLTMNRLTEDIKGAFGLGIRMNFLGALVLRWDFGRRTDYRTYVENKTFTQFFFGWDF